MSQPNFIILYVDQPEASARFYAGLLGREAVESSPTFALFALESGVMLGLWSRHTVEPAPAAGPGSSELAFALESDAQVDATHASWTARGLPMLQAPVRMDFGYTFVAQDPDGHRLRVFAPGA
jgi:predicted enzyme related to lactoylglutathione lyase